MNKKTLVIFNPVAGNEEASEYLVSLVREISVAGGIALCYATGKTGDAYRIAQEFGASVDDIITIGGDGTLSEVSAGLVEAGIHATLGYIPAGTTNDFAGGLGLSKGDKKARIGVATRGERMPLDMGRLNGKPFLYVAGFGAFTSVSYRTSQVSKNVMGRMAYFVEGLKDISQLKPYHLTVDFDGEQVEGDFLLGLISNSNQIGGMLDLSDRTNYHDGRFEGTLIRNGFSPLEYAGLASDLMNGKTTHPACVSFQAKRITIRSAEALAWTLDGEQGDETTENVIEVIPEALHVRAGDPSLGEASAKEEAAE